MSEPEKDLIVARDDAVDARERFYASLWGVRERISPGSLRHDAVAAIKGRAADAIGQVQKRPALAVGIGAAALLLLLRKPLRAATKRRKKETDDE
jgi:ElaB/YqjD/DUF883 family membrane-anchored ribosome-binding protein